MAGSNHKNGKMESDGETSGSRRMIRLLVSTLLAASLPLTGGLRTNAADQNKYSARRESILSKLPPGSAAVLTSGGEPEYGEFHRDPDFYYLTGESRPDLLLVLERDDTGWNEILIAPLPDTSKLDWTGYVVPADSLRESTGISTVVDSSRLSESLSAALSGADTLFLMGDGWDVVGRIRNYGELEPFFRGESRLPTADLSPYLTELRLIKDRDELERLQRAVDITAASLNSTLGRIEAGLQEYEVEALIEYGFTSRGARRTAFPSIIASGPNSCILHYRMNRRRLEEGDLLLMDIGAEYDGYTADITRTVPVNGRFTPRQREIYDLVLQAQLEAIRAVKPGVTLRDVHRAARAVLDEAGVGDRFLHFTSHFLGLEVHDSGSKDIPLRPNMVLTVEPGIYIVEEALGIRIEDDVVVTETGCRVISDNLPKAVDEIEAIMAGKAR